MRKIAWERNFSCAGAQCYNSPATVQRGRGLDVRNPEFFESGEGCTVVPA